MGVNMKRSFITIYVVLFVVLLTGCVAKEGSTDMPLFSNVKTVGKAGLTPEDIIDHSEDTGENRDALMPEDEDENVEENVAHAIINPMGEILKERIDVPAGYVRTPEAEGSLGDFLRNYRLLPDGSPVLLYDGRVKTTDSAVCVFDMYLGDKDLQQCADSVIRVYAEYMRATGMEEKIAFHFVSGFLCDWTSYKNGNRIFVNGNDVSWKSGSNVTDSDEVFEKYLETVFNYASTLSVERESEPIDIAEIQI